MKGDTEITDERGSRVFIFQLLAGGALPTCVGAHDIEEIDANDVAGLSACIAELGGELVLAGEVIGTRADSQGWESVVMAAFPSREALARAQARVPDNTAHRALHPPQGRRWTFVAEPMDTPANLTAPPTDEPDHVVNLVLFSYLDPDEMEAFLKGTRGLASAVGAQREAWLEITSQLVEPDVVFDEIFLSRYPNLDAWVELHANEEWNRHTAVLEEGMQSFLDLVVRPRVNRIAHHQDP